MLKHLYMNLYRCIWMSVHMYILKHTHSHALTLVKAIVCIVRHTSTSSCVYLQKLSSSCGQALFFRQHVSTTTVQSSGLFCALKYCVKTEDSRAGASHYCLIKGMNRHFLLRRSLIGQPPNSIQQKCI